MLSERPNEAEALEEQLTECCARAHELERQALKLERQSASMLARGATPEQVHAVLQERGVVDTDLRNLRRRVDELRAALRRNRSYIGPSA